GASQNITKMSATLRVILGVDNASKLTLPTGIPDSMEDLKQEITRQFNLSGNFRLQYRDKDFDNEFVNLSTTAELADKSTIKIIYMPGGSGTSTHRSAPHQRLDFDSSSSSLADTDILSSPESTSSGSSFRSQLWPQTFPIHQFSYEVEIQLEKANHAFHNSGTFLNPSTKLKSDILEGLASEMIKYKMYSLNEDFDHVALALITKHPCLKEQGSVSGHYGWKISLKYKMANYRTRLRNIGCPELSINAAKEKRGTTCKGPNQVKKPRKAEVNYCPDYPIGETKASLELERQTLLLEVKKKNQPLIKAKMERTFAYRRQEIIQDMPFITEFRDRWPALFSESEINAEFTHINTVTLLSRFMSKLDHYSNQLMKVFRKKGGAAGHKISMMVAAMDKVGCSMKWFCVATCQCACIFITLSIISACHYKFVLVCFPDSFWVVYLERSWKAMLSDMREQSPQYDEDVGIIIEGVEVLQDLRDVANGCAVLFGLVYSLNLTSPKDLRYMFELFQKVLMDLDGNRLSTKVQVLKNRLHE
uniref:PB1 domain-containing protein n=1 Tax=Amphiprion percula TaxID=161767 RepID=A0A3P8TP41_AMPPE